MTITLDLPEETVAVLRVVAAEQGRSIEEVVSDELTALYTDDEIEDD